MFYIVKIKGREDVRDERGDNEIDKHADCLLAVRRFILLPPRPLSHGPLRFLPSSRLPPRPPGTRRSPLRSCRLRRAPRPPRGHASCQRSVSLARCYRLHRSLGIHHLRLHLPRHRQQQLPRRREGVQSETLVGPVVQRTRSGITLRYTKPTGASYLCRFLPLVLVALFFFLTFERSAVSFLVLQSALVSHDPRLKARLSTSTSYSSLSSPSSISGSSTGSTGFLDMFLLGTGHF
ncbi:hypothetical protein C8Q73DRAFT_717757 [Cubamyces lactineus]|nr:hypothetical protein C8Q73DRAFT_717757 [Cubamyces lactineus]